MKEFEIAGIKIKNRYVLAPMAGFTDVSTRILSSSCGASLVYTEMESCDSLVYKSKRTLKDIQDTFIDRKKEEDTKIALQLFSGKKDMVLQSIPIVEKNASYDFLDFNCGCPVPKVIRQQAGSYWLNREDELIDLLKDMVKLSDKPVIVKIRIGFSSLMDIVPLCLKIEEAGVKAIAVHGRSRNEFFSGEVHYDVIKDIKKNLSIPVIANGEIDQDNFQDVLDKTDADALMIGQHALGNPSIFKDMIDLEEGKRVKKRTLQEQLDLLRKHIDLIFEYKDEREAAAIMRSFSVKYLKGFDNIKKYRNRLVVSKSKDEYLSIIDDIKRSL